MKWERISDFRSQVTSAARSLLSPWRFTFVSECVMKTFGRAWRMAGRKEGSWNAGCRGEGWPGGDNFWFTLYSFSPTFLLPTPPDSHFLTYTLSGFARRGLLLQLTFNGGDRETYACRVLSPSFTSSSSSSCSSSFSFCSRPHSLHFSSSSLTTPEDHSLPPHNLHPENLERQDQLVK